MKKIFWCGLGLVVVGLVMAYDIYLHTYGLYIDTRMADAQERLANLGEQNATFKAEQARHTWQKVEDAALALTHAEAEKREDALYRFLHELHRLQSRMGYETLQVPKTLEVSR